MFIGHNALAFAVKKYVPELSLGTMFVAVQLPDLVWPVLLITGTEQVEPIKGATGFGNLRFVAYPYSHSLLGVILTGLAFAALFTILGGSKSLKAFLFLVAGVISHWILDWIVHVPDLPFLPNDATKTGLGLWQFPAFTALAELAMFFGGIALYLRSTKPRGAVGKWSLWSLVVVLLMIYAGTALAPAPPSWQAVAYTGLSAWLIVFWGYWIDRNRLAEVE